MITVLTGEPGGPFAILAHRLAAGAKGGLLPEHRPLERRSTTKIHGLVNDQGRPSVLLLSAGNTNDITLVQALVEVAGPFQKLQADRDYHADHLAQGLPPRRTPLRQARRPFSRRLTRRCQSSATGPNKGGP